MLTNIRAWTARRDDLRRLEMMNDRLLEDIGVDRADLRTWLTGPVASADTTTRPLPRRIRSAVSAFLRELRTAEPSHLH